MTFYLPRSHLSLTQDGHMTVPASHRFNQQLAPNSNHIEQETESMRRNGSCVFEH